VNRVVIYPDAAVKVLDTDECRAWLDKIAKAGLARAQSTAPVRSGEYRSSLVAGVTEGPDGPRASIGSTSFKWHWVEFGSVNNRPHRVLTEMGRALSNRFVST